MSKENPTAREKALKALGPDSQAIKIILEELKKAPDAEKEKFAKSCIMLVYPKKKQKIMLPNGHQKMKAIKDRKTGEYKQVPDFEMVEDRTAEPKQEINMGKAKTWYLNYTKVETKRLPKREKSNYELYAEALGLNK